MIIKKRLVLCSVLPLAMFLSAEEPIELKELVVYPAVETVRIGSFGALQSTVFKQQIDDLNAFDLQGALKNVPGITVSKLNVVGNFGGAEGGGVFIRGIGASRPGGELLTLVDDIPKLVSVWGHPMMDFLNINIVDRVEIYKGAQPVKFGNTAFAAVNLITRRAFEDGNDGKLSLQYGSFNTFKETFMFAGKDDKFDYLFANTYARSDGHRKDSDGYIFNATTKLGYELNDNWDALLFLNVSDNYANDPGSSDPEVLSKGEYYTDDFMMIASLENSSDQFDGYIKAYYQYGKLDWQDQDETSGLDTITKYSQYGTHLKETLYADDSLDILGGFDLDISTGRIIAKNPADTDKKSDYATFIISSPYASASKSFDAFVESTFSVGARYFFHNEFDSEFAPEAGLVFKYDDTKLSFNYARGINYPGLFVEINSDIFMPGDNKWQDLDAETMDHFEATAQQKMFDNIVLTLSGFFDYGHDRIIVVAPPFPPSWQNIQKYHTKGFEASASWKIMEKASFFTGATWIYEAEPYDLPYVPEFSFNFGITWHFANRWKFVIDGTYMDSYYAFIRKRNAPNAAPEKVDSFFVSNCKLYYTQPMKHDIDVVFSLFLDNIFDEDYEYYPGYEMPGTAIMFGIEMEM
jgi:outer membrane receptor protein involved in Fe transport